MNHIENVSDITKPHILTAWQLLTRNPAFIGEPLLCGYPMRSFVLFTLFEPRTTSDVRSQIVVSAQQRLHELTGDIDATHPTADQLRDYFKFIPIIKLQHYHIFRTNDDEHDYSTICRLDSDYVKLMDNIFEFEHDMSPRVGKVSKTGFTTSLQRYPYSTIGILPPEDTTEIQHTLNKIASSNMNAMIRLLSTFPRSLVESMIVKTLNACPNFNYGAIYLLAANELNLSQQIIESTLFDRIEHQRDDAVGVGLIGVAICLGIINESNMNDILRHQRVMNNMHNFFEGLGYLSGLYPINNKLKPLILEAAQDVYTRSDISSYVKYTTKDVIDELMGEVSDSPRFAYFAEEQRYTNFA